MLFFFFTNIDNYYDTPNLRTLNFKLQALLSYYIVAILAIFLTFANVEEKEFKKEKVNGKIERMSWAN